ncbi:fungal specific transcription factor [Diplodia corticola]|uniref:Fungal specific transcription factor n=1 Tax=Diplodia corticola TaxID=236234 RepID=A0A1J9QJM8_9PEZI|nr:fungal specific transcription factor [Diplodia corticola]OJD28688.1 fungal specific transcription factor [Diplodia corticola]
MSTMITFAANNEFFRKRKRVHKACDSCKKRRKRCVHTFDVEEPALHPDSSSASNSFPAQPVPPGAQRANAAPTSAAGSYDAPAPGFPEPDHAARLLGPDDARLAPGSRFIGYASPEAVLRGHIREQGSKCGGWVPATPDDEPEPSPSARDHSEDGADAGRASSESGASRLDKALRAYLDAVGVNVVPPQRHVDFLLGIYFEYVHPLLPLVDQRHFYTRRSAGEQSTMLLQAISLVASRHECARSHLYLSSDPSYLLEPREYARQLYAALLAGLNANLEEDRITLIQILTLMSLYSEGVDGADRASMHLVQAIHHAHTIGLQFGRQRNVPKGESTEKIFWCLWSLDKLNASMNGRPQYMNERDNQLENWTARPEQRRTPFGIWLQLAGILDRVIELYRPGCDSRVTGLENDFPGFEDIIGDGGDKLRGPIVAALELFYHAVAMLSHKSRSITDPVRSTPSFVRQSLSAVRVISILSHEFPDDLPPLPMVPYTLALAMSVAYRQYRRSKLQGHKNRAKEDLKTCCSLLNKLRATWWCAGCMADLGAAALSKAEKAEQRNNGILAVGAAADETTTNPLARIKPSSAFRSEQPVTPSSDDVSNGNTTAPTTAKERGDEAQSPTSSTVRNLLNNMSSAVPQMMAGGQPQHAVSSERSEQTRMTTATTASTAADFNSNESPDWLNFDNAFENMDTLLGSSGADLSNELLRGFNWDLEEFSG